MLQACSKHSRSIPERFLMSNDKTLPEFRWIALDMSQFDQETASLTDSERMGYLRLRAYSWRYGSLPDDPARLANIARLPSDAWSIAWSNAQASLKHRFFLGPDGMLHHKKDEQERAKKQDKGMKRKEKAIHAANVRWGKYKAKLDARGDAPSIAPSMPEAMLGGMQEFYREEQEQKQKQPLPTLPARREGLGSAPSIGDAPSIPDAPSMPAAALPRASAPKRQAGNGASVGKAKPADFASITHRDAPDDTHHHSAASNGRGVAVTPSSTNIQVMSPKPRLDSRGESIKSELFGYWREQNPEHPECPWRPADDRAVIAFLEQNRNLSIARFRELLINRAASDVNPAALPHKWLRDLIQFAAGPADRYGKPLRAARQL